MVRLWHITRRLFWALRLTVWLVLLAVAGCYAWLHYAGLPQAAKDRLVRELARRGIAARFDHLHLDLPATLRAEDVSLGDVRAADRPLIHARQVRIGFDFSRILRGQPPVPDALRLAGGKLSLPVDFDDPKSDRLEAGDLNGELRLFENNSLVVERLSAAVFGIRVSLHGRLQLPRPDGPRKPPLTPEERERRVRLLRRVQAEVAAFQWRQPPAVTIRFRADANDPAGAEAGAEIAAGPVSHARYSVEGLQAQLQYASNQLHAARVELRRGASRVLLEQARYDFGKTNGAALVTATVSLKDVTPLLPAEAQKKIAEWGQDAQVGMVSNNVSFQPAVLRAGPMAIRAAGGTLTVGGSCDFAAGEAAFQVHSTVDPKQLTVFMPQGWQRSLGEWEWKKNPDLTFAFLWNKADPTHPTITGGKAVLEDAAFRGIQVRRGVCRAELRNDTIYLTDAVVDKTEGGIIQGSYACHLTKQDFEFRGVQSTVDPFTLLPLFSSNVVRALREFTFNQPPEVLGDWQGNWQLANSHRCQGRFFSRGPMTWRGVVLSDAQCGFAYTVPVIQLRDGVITRPEGQVKGDYVFNFETSDFSADVKGTLDLDALRPVLGEAARRVLDQYHPEAPVKFDLDKAQGNWQRLDQCVIAGALETGPLAANLGKLKSASATFTLDPAKIEVPNFTIKVHSGEVTGRLAHDRAAQRLTVEAGKCDVQPLEIAQLLGSNFVAMISPYQFHKDPTLRDVKATMDFCNPDQTSWSVFVDAPDVAWWKLRLRDVNANMAFSQNILTVTNFDARSFYGGRLWPAWGRFDLGKTPLRYEVEFHVPNCKSDELMEALFGYQKVSGTLQGNARVEGVFGDYDSMRGRGRLHLVKGQLWKVPIFGRLSTLLGQVVPARMVNPEANEADATFLIENGFVHLPAAKGHDPATIIASPHLITGAGKWRVGGELDFNVYVRLLRGAGPVRMITDVLEPLTGPFENVLAGFKLTGTLANPQWRPLYLPKLPGLGGKKPPAEPAPEPKK